MTPLSIAQRTVIGSAIEEAVTLLPEGFELRLHISKGDVGVVVESDNRETWPVRDTLELADAWPVLADCIRDLTQAAIEAGEGGRLTPKRKP